MCTWTTFARAVSVDTYGAIPLGFQFTFLKSAITRLMKPKTGLRCGLIDPGAEERSAGSAAAIFRYVVLMLAGTMRPLLTEVEARMSCATPRATLQKLEDAWCDDVAAPAAVAEVNATSTSTSGGATSFMMPSLRWRWTDTWCSR